MKFVGRKLAGIFIVLLIVCVCLVFKFNNKETELDSSKQNLSSEMFAIMLEQSDGSYKKSDSNSWPSGTYVYNSEKSGCVDSDGNIIENSLIYSSNKVILNTSSSSYCYVYFDLVD